MKKIKIIVVSIAVLLIAAQNLTMFKIPSMLGLELGTSFWICFAFLNFAFVTTTLMLWFGLSDKKDATIHLGALLGVSYGYLVEEIVLANVFIYYPNAKTTPVLLCQLASFLVYLATILMVFLGVFWKEKNNKVVNEKVNFISSLEIELTKASRECNDSEIKEKIDNLKEKIHYSDPMSKESAKEEEAKLLVLVSKIQSGASTKSKEELLSLIKQAELTLLYRNEICLKTK